jgi:hypothetical protein
VGRLRVAFVLVVAVTLPLFAESFQIKKEVPTELWEPVRPSNNASLVVAENVDFAEPRFEGVGQGEVRVSVPGARALRVETMPELAVVGRDYALPAGARAEVFWDSAVLQETDGPVPLRAQPETFYWSNDPSFRLAEPSTGRFYPGKLVDFVQSGSQVRVRFYPLQWDRQNRTVVRMGRLAVKVFAVPLEAEQPTWRPSAQFAPQSVILVREAMVEAARLLQTFHSERYKIASEIVTVESLEKRETELPESDLPDGYKDRSLADAVVVPYDAASGKGYNYRLARKLAQYFQRSLGAGSALKYITLVGDSTAIPPSYYFSVRTGFDARFGVTDQCYAAVAQCLEPRAAVGRLPLQSLGEMKTYLAKTDRWLKYSEAAPSELALFGGKAFNGPFYIGELGVLRALSEKADWRGVRKSFRTKQNYTRGGVLETVRGNGDSSFVYSLDHGGGNQWYVEQQSVGSRDVMAATNAGSTVNPLIFSIACTNGAYDEKLLQEDLYEDPSHGAHSVGVSLIRSVAGAVGYFGSSRPALGAPIFEIDARGNLDLQDSNHGLKLLDTALEEYRVKGSGRLGDYVRSTLARYATDPASLVTKDRFRWTYLNAVLLGDPAMTLATRSVREAVSPMARSVDEIQAAFRGTNNVPAMLLPESGDAALRIQSKTDVEATLFVQGQGLRFNETLLKTKTVGAGDADIAFNDSQGRQTYFMRLENKTGVPVERQVWFRTQ